MKWSVNLGENTNGCLSLMGEYSELECLPDPGIRDSEFNRTVLIQGSGSHQGSKAAQACAAIGGRLPTFPEYKKLLRSLNYGSEYTEKANGPWLTSYGFEVLSAIFGNEDMHLPFWTSSLFMSDAREDWYSRRAWSFSPSGYVHWDRNRDDQANVRCVSDN